MTMRAVTMIAVPTRGEEGHRAVGGIRPPIGVNAVVPAATGSGADLLTSPPGGAEPETEVSRIVTIVPITLIRRPHLRGVRTGLARVVRDAGTIARRQHGAAMTVTIARARDAEAQSAEAGTIGPGRTAAIVMSVPVRTGRAGQIARTRTAVGRPTTAPARTGGPPDRGAMIGPSQPGAGMRRTSVRARTGQIRRIVSSGTGAPTRIAVDGIHGRGAPGTSVPIGSRGASAPATNTGRTESAAGAATGIAATAASGVRRAPKGVRTTPKVAPRRGGPATAAT